MKRLAFIAGMILTLGLTGCGSRGGEEADSAGGSSSGSEQTNTDEQNALSGSDSLTDQVDSYLSTDTAPDETSEGDGDSGTEGDASGGSTGQSVSDGDGSFEAKDDTVYATANVVVRNKPSTSGDPVMNLKQGEGIHRVGYSQDWTKVELNGYYYYIATKYLSETQ